MADLRLVGMTKRYGSTVAADSVDLYVADREFVTLLGPSGSGKTTVLRMIAGHTEPTDGTLLIGGRDMTDAPPERRDIGMVFQSYALFPHMTVRKNVSFGLDRRGIPGAERDRRVAEVLDLVQLSGLEHRYPRQLSGGQQQRVALARALVIRPSLLLLDEPLSNLDAKLRNEVRIETRRIQRELGITTVLVTHDQEEALAVSDRIAVMHHGRILQVASPLDLYFKPCNHFVADFLGKSNFLAGTRVDETDGSLARYRLDGGDVVLAPRGPERAVLSVRPEHLRIGPAPKEQGVNSLSGALDYRLFLGEMTETCVRLQSGTMMLVRAVARDQAAPNMGQTIGLWWRASDTLVFPMEQPQSI